MFFGGTDVALRSLSVLFISISIVFAYLLVKRLFGRKKAGICALMLSISPMLIRYGQEARMYAMVTAIALSATYVLVLLVENKNKKWLWIIYSVLIALGMLTHYFMALVWITHCLWYLSQSDKVSLREVPSNIIHSKFIKSYMLAILLFLPWVPHMIAQFSTIQSNGFWISPVSADTMTNALTNMFFYLDHDQVQGWLGLFLVILVAGIIYMAVRSFNFIEKQKKNFLFLILMLSVVPVILLYLCSLPPLRSSFVERYVLSSYAFLAIFICVICFVNINKGFVRDKIIAYIVLALSVMSMIIGINYVNYYGTYNKNTSTTSETKQLIAMIHKKSPNGEPITVTSPWVYYEAVVYNTNRFPVYFIQGNTQYKFGSLTMIKENNYHKITNINKFSSHFKKVWCIDRSGTSELVSPDQSWKLINSFRLDDIITGQPAYEANEYETNV
jgi:uncharacterized membrane protein